MITTKDLKIINEALAQYQALLEGDDWVFNQHKDEYGNPVKTVQATQIRVLNEIQKREACN